MKQLRLRHVFLGEVDQLVVEKSVSPAERPEVLMNVWQPDGYQGAGIYLSLRSATHLRDWLTRWLRENRRKRGSK